MLVLHRADLVFTVLYCFRDTARYDYTHEILPDATSIFKGTKVPRDRRISVICRNEPS